MSSACDVLPYPFNEICNAVNSFISGVSNVGQAVAGGLVFLSQGIYNFAQQLYNALINFATSVGNAFITAYNYIKTAFDDLGNYIGNAIYGFGSWVASGFSAFAGWVSKGFYSFVDYLVRFVNWAWSGIVSVFGTIYNAFRSGIETIISSAEGTIVNIQNAIVSRLNNVIFTMLSAPLEMRIGKQFILKPTIGGVLKLIFTPIIAKIIADFITGWFTPQPIQQVFSRPQLPELNIQTQSLIPPQPPTFTTYQPTTAPYTTSTITVSLAETIVTGISTINPIALLQEELVVGTAITNVYLTLNESIVDPVTRFGESIVIASLQEYMDITDFTVQGLGSLIAYITDVLAPVNILLGSITVQLSSLSDTLFTLQPLLNSSSGGYLVENMNAYITLNTPPIQVYVSLSEQISETQTINIALPPVIIGLEENIVGSVSSGVLVGQTIVISDVFKLGSNQAQAPPGTITLTISDGVSLAY